MRDMDFLTILSVLLKGMRWIILFTVVAAVLFGAYAAFLVDETYRSEFQMYVSNITDQNANQSATTGGLSASQSLVKEYIVIMKNDIVVNQVAENLKNQGYLMSNAAIRRAMKLSSENGTAMLNVVATTTDPELSKAICDAVATSAPSALQKVMPLGSVKIMAPARKGSKTGPNVVYDAIIGAVLGFVVSCAVTLVISLLDNTVKDERELKRHFDITVLGEVPTMFAPQKGGKTYGGK